MISVKSIKCLDEAEADNHYGIDLEFHRLGMAEWEHKRNNSCNDEDFH